MDGRCSGVFALECVSTRFSASSLPSFASSIYSTWTWRCLRTRRFAPCSLGISPLKEPAIETGHHQRVPIIIAAVLVIVNVVLSILFIFTEKIEFNGVLLRRMNDHYNTFIIPIIRQ